MKEKKPGITMTDVKAAAVKVAPKVHKPGITTNMVNAPVPLPRAPGPVVWGPVITTHDIPAPVRDVDDHSQDAPAPAPKAKRKPAARKKA